MRESWSNYVIWGLVAVLFILLVCIAVFQIQERYLANDPMLHELRKDLTPVHPAIKDLTLLRGDKSYTINKEKVYLCLKDKDGNYYSKNTLYYVFLHELAHVLNPSIGHTEEFQKTFESLLDKAIQLGIFDPSIPIPTDYCE